MPFDCPDGCACPAPCRSRRDVRLRGSGAEAGAGRGSQTHQDFHDRIARRHKQEFRWHVDGRRHFEPGFPGAGPDRQNERFGRPERQERHRHRRDQSPRVHAANGGRQGYLSDGPVAARAQQAADRTAGDFASGLRDGRSRLRPGAHGLRQLEKHSSRHEAGRAVLGCRRESLCRQLPAGSGGRAGCPACQSADAFGQVHDARKRTANPQTVRPRVYRPVRQLSERRIRCPPQRVCPELDALPSR